MLCTSRHHVLLAHRIKPNCHLSDGLQLVLASFLPLVNELNNCYAHAISRRLLAGCGHSMKTDLILGMIFSSWPRLVTNEPFSSGPDLQQMNPSPALALQHTHPLSSGPANYQPLQHSLPMFPHVGKPANISAIAALIAYVPAYWETDDGLSQWLLHQAPSNSHQQVNVFLPVSFHYSTVPGNLVATNIVFSHSSKDACLHSELNHFQFFFKAKHCPILHRLNSSKPMEVWLNFWSYCGQLSLQWNCDKTESTAASLAYGGLPQLPMLFLATLYNEIWVVQSNIHVLPV